MTFTIPPWAIPMALTTAIAVAAAVWPTSPNRDAYGCSLFVQGLLHIASAIIAVLLVWIAYLATV